MPPSYLTRHTVEEVAGWFAEAGLTGVVDLSRDQVFYHEGQGHGINLAGYRPNEPPSEGERTLEPGAVAALVMPRRRGFLRNQSDRDGAAPSEPARPAPRLGQESRVKQPWGGKHFAVSL